MPASTAAPNPVSALDFLLQRINFERTTNIPYRAVEFKLDRMRRLMGLLGDPQLALKAVHIAGTKGKGSTAAMTAAILQAAGYRTGLYTSPHLEQIEERIVVDGQICPTDAFLALAAQVQPAVEQLDCEAAAAGNIGPTFFEVTTAMAFLHFAQAKVDAAVLEVGLGGRLDSTNVCQPEVCIITSISFDHTRQLGSTLAAIAGEKAGIIKPGIPVVSGVIDEEPREVIAARAVACNAPLIQRGRDYDFTAPEPPLTEHSPNTSFTYLQPARSPTYELPNLQLGMLGTHQAANAASAIAAINRLRQRGWSIGDEAIRKGLSTAHCPARIELVSEQPAVILDVAHNLASIEALLTVLENRFPARRRLLVFASSKDKDYGGMLRRLLPAFDVAILTRYVNNPRAMEPEALLAIAQQIRAETADGQASPALHAAARPADAWRLARLIADPADLICITGSFFLAAELRSVVGRDRVNEPLALATASRKA
jgi:dihydrofolate synthase/folylpolyglutamate synthase